MLDDEDEYDPCDDEREEDYTGKACHGDGTVEGDDTDENGAPTFYRCPACNGRGSV